MLKRGITSINTIIGVLIIVSIFGQSWPVLAVDQQPKNGSESGFSANPYENINLVTPNIKQIQNDLSVLWKRLQGPLNSLQKPFRGVLEAIMSKTTGQFKTELLKQKREFKKKYKTFYDSLIQPIIRVGKNLKDFWDKD